MFGGFVFLVLLVVLSLLLFVVFVVFVALCLFLLAFGGLQAAIPR